MTIFAFQPSQTSPYQFQPTFDGQEYTCIVTWNVFGQRYYVSCYNLAGDRIFTVPMVGSPLDYDISLTAGYFTSKLIWRIAAGQFEVTP